LAIFRPFTLIRCELIAFFFAEQTIKLLVVYAFLHKQSIKLNSLSNYTKAKKIANFFNRLVYIT